MKSDFQPVSQKFWILHCLILSVSIFISVSSSAQKKKNFPFRQPDHVPGEIRDDTPKYEVANLTIKERNFPSLDFIIDSKKIITILPGQGNKITYHITNEHVIAKYIFGNIGIILTNRSILGIHTSSSEWAIKNIFGEEYIREEMASGVGVILTNKRIYFFSPLQNTWYQQNYDGEFVSSIGAKGNTATVITNKNLYVFNGNETEIRKFSIVYHDSKMLNFKILDDKILFEEKTKSIIYDISTGTFEATTRY